MTILVVVLLLVPCSFSSSCRSSLVMFLVFGRSLLNSRVTVSFHHFCNTIMIFIFIFFLQRMKVTSSTIAVVA